jgi:hypothetical protein
MHNPTLDSRSISVVRVMHRAFASESVRAFLFCALSFEYMDMKSVSGDETWEQS